MEASGPPPRFVAQLVRNQLIEMKINQELTKPPTPEQNAHIQSYHSIVERTICQKYQLGSLKIGENDLHTIKSQKKLQFVKTGLQILSMIVKLENIGLDVIGIAPGERMSDKAAFLPKDT
jgi:putative transposase